jgi:selenocysteine lyase/cysteine desulfurase
MSQKRKIELVGWDDRHSPGILSFKCGNVDHNALSEYLFNQYQIVVKPINYPESPECIRLSWSILTKEAEVQFLIEKINEALYVYG